jgi:hypothetical protein
MLEIFNNNFILLLSLILFIYIIYKIYNINNINKKDINYEYYIKFILHNNLL